MTRILADLPDEDIEWLDRLAEQEGKSRAAVLREAVASFKAEPRAGDTGWIDAGFGLWARNGITIDPVEYDRKRRAEWTRPWDDVFEDVRAESPDLFGEEDDRQRAVYLAMMSGHQPPPRKSGGA